VPGSLVGVDIVIFAVLALHLIVGTTIIALGDRIGRRGFALAAIAPVLTLAWLATELGPVLDGEPVLAEAGWVPEIGLTIGLRLDPLGAVMVLLVSGIGLLVCIYALGYFSHPKPGTARLAGLLTLFAGAMLGVVVSDHLLALFLFWELTSVTSYLLIGNDDTNPRARDAAASAILITGAGGLAMLAGLVTIGQSAGTYRLSELDAASLDGSRITVGAVLVLIGAFTKSAQLPFAGWLPGAMVAPTPISTYLHAATMVKAGVFLVARLAPAMADVAVWRPIILVVSSATMIVGGWRALRQYDLKLLLAHGTVSQLGFMMLLFGMGAYDLAQAGVVLLLAHGAFKAALFMVVGIVDHQAGTRDIRALTGWGPGWRPVTIVAVIAAASMAGVPPVVGFIAKEKALDAALHGDFAGAGALVAVLIAGSILTFAYSARFVLGVFGVTGRSFAARGELHDGDTPTAAAPSPGFVGPAVSLGAATVVFGLLPVSIDRLVRAATTAAYPSAKPKSVVLWAGVNQALLWSLVIIATGIVLTLLRSPVSEMQRRFHRIVAPVPDAERTFWAIVTGVLSTAKRLTRIFQNGSLPIYLMVILAVAAIAPTIPAVTALDEFPDVTSRWAHVPIAVVIVMAAIGTTMVHRRIAAALMLGAVGFAMSVFYVIEGAPDLALTQFAIETLATVLFVLVLRFLPRRITESTAAVVTPVRVAVSVLVGVAVFVLALAAGATRSDVAAPPISDEMVERSVPDGKGANVVNVILVDFRGLDTLGEITVLLVAGLGIVALARTTRRTITEPGGTLLERLPLLDLFSQLLFGSIVVLSVYFLFAGHNQPGGGFVGGLTAGAAISLRYVAGGSGAVRSSVPMRPWTVLGGGLLIAATTAIVPLLTGNSVLEHGVFDADLPLLGSVKTTSALPFDIGVFLVVVGLVLMAYEAFGDEGPILDEVGAA
jgi:multicomponent Na+:H+ antiporter subunit A